MYEGRVVLSVSNAYEQKYYLNEDFAGLPKTIQDELKIMCVLYTEDVGGILSLVFELIGCAISRYSPSVAFLLGIAINSPFSPSITLMSCTTNSSSIVIDTTAFILPSLATFLTRTSVIFMILIPFQGIHDET